MGEAGHLRVWSLRTMFVAIVFLILLRALLPIRLDPPAIPGPDLLVCLIFAWVWRRPDVMTAWLIVFSMLLADFLFQRPPGLWTALVLIGSESLRRQTMREGEKTHAFEFGVVALIIASMILMQRIILFVLLVPQPPLGAMLLHLLTTLAIYPVVVVFSIYIVGVRPLPQDDGGKRLRT
jgi:rod shape-determining protein MreD